jgi:hypothetical protein
VIERINRDRQLLCTGRVARTPSRAHSQHGVSDVVRHVTSQ